MLTQNEKNKLLSDFANAAHQVCIEENEKGLTGFIPCNLPDLSPLSEK